MMAVETLSPVYSPEVPVRNKVLWVNPQIDLPFNLAVGKSTNLGVFLVDHRTVSNDSFKLGVASNHGRSVHLGRVKISDSNGNIYRDVDLKGAGYVKGNGTKTDPSFVTPISIKGKDSTFGIWRFEKAQREVDITEDLTAKGVRTYRIGALIELEEIALPDGTKISITEAKSRGIMNVDEKPVIGLRLYRNRMRVQDKYPNTSQVLCDAKKMVELELGREMTWQEYLCWFSTSLGSSIAGIHNAGYWHGAIDAHNVTLSAEIMDFGFDWGEKDYFSKKLEDLSSKVRGYEISDDYRKAYERMCEIVRAVQWDLDRRAELMPGTHFGKMFHKAYVDTSITHDAPAEEPDTRRHSQSKLKKRIAQKLKWTGFRNN